MTTRTWLIVVVTAVAIVGALWIVRPDEISTEGFSPINLSEAEISPGPPFDFFELRQGWPGDSLNLPPEVVQGEPCSTAQDRETCLSDYDALLAAGGPAITTGCVMCQEWFLITGLGNELAYIGSDEAFSFVGPIDTMYEAALMVGGASWAKQVEGGTFHVIRREFLEVCDPIVEAVLLLEVTSEGSISELRREVTKTQGECI